MIKNRRLSKVIKPNIAWRDLVPKIENKADENQVRTSKNRYLLSFL